MTKWDVIGPAIAVGLDYLAKAIEDKGNAETTAALAEVRQLVDKVRSAELGRYVDPTGATAELDRLVADLAADRRAADDALRRKFAPEDGEED